MTLSTDDLTHLLVLKIKQVKNCFYCSVQVFFFFVSTTSSQPVSLSDREVISRLRNCLLALSAHKVLVFDTSVLYCYESSLQHQVGSREK